MIIINDITMMREVEDTIKEDTIKEKTTKEKTIKENAIAIITYPKNLLNLANLVKTVQALLTTTRQIIPLPI